MDGHEGWNGFFVNRFVIYSHQVVTSPFKHSNRERATDRKGRPQVRVLASFDVEQDQSYVPQYSVEISFEIK